MKKYYVKDFKNKETYMSFIKYMLKNSDAFSFIYFKYKENEKVKATVKKVKSELQKFKIFSRRVNEWPGTITLNQQNHIYDMVIYKADYSVLETLLSVDDIYDWDYPCYPMDLSFFKDGYAWFYCTSHEGFNRIYIDDKETLQNLEDLGVEFEFMKNVDISELFYEEKAKISDK